MKVDHFRRDAFYLLKAALTNIQSPQCDKDDVDMAIRNTQKALNKLEDFDAQNFPEAAQ